MSARILNLVPACCLALCTIFFSGVACAQTPTADFNFPGTVCLNQQVTLDNASANATDYLWDFCFSDLKAVESTLEVTTIGDASVPTGISLIYEQGEWYGFLSNWGTHKIIRLDFGNNLENTPTVADLGNFGGLLSQPQNIEFVKHGSTVHAILTNFGNGHLIRLSFNGGMEVVPDATDLGNLGGWGQLRGLDLFQTGSSYYAIVADFSNSKLSLINFGSAITNNPAAGDVTAITESVSNPIGVRVVESAGNLFGFVASYGTNTIKRIAFGPALSATPVISTVYGLNRPTEISLHREGAEFQLYSATEGGSVHHVLLGSSPADFVSGTNRGTFGLLNNTFGFDIERSTPIWYGFTIDYISNKLFRMKFSGTCASKVSANSSTQAEPSIQYSEAGSYAIELTARTASQVSVKTGQINILNQAAPEVTIPVDFYCVNSNLEFTATALGGQEITYWKWTVDQGQVFEEESPIYQYNTTGQYNLVLEFTVASGCSNRHEQQISIVNSPISDFDLPGNPLCTNQSYLFNNTSQADPGSVVSWQWIVNDEEVSTDEDLLHSFVDSGVKVIKLTASIPGCSDVHQETVNNLVQGPLVDFASAGSCEEQDITFTGTVHGAVTSVLWDFGDGKAASELATKNTYTDPGNYNVKLSVVSPTGCNNSKEQAVTISPKPVANFSVAGPPSTCSGSETVFTDTSTDPDGLPLSTRLWDFGDGGTASTTTPSHIYDQAGTYPVTLTVTSAAGCDGSKQQNVAIVQAPLANMVYGPTCVGLPVTFSAPAPSISDYYWEIGTSYYTDAMPLHTFGAPGSYPVRLILKATNNCETIYNKTIVVPVPLVPDFSVSKNCTNSLAQFIDLTAGSDPVMAQSWNFSEQGTGSSSPASFTFTSPGNKLIKLTVAGQSGCVYTTQKTISVVTPPSASFDALPEKGAAPLSVQFNNTSIGATQYAWTFNDGSAASAQTSPAHIFQGQGEFVTELIALNAQGCESTASRIITVFAPLPDVDIRKINLSENPDGTTQVIITLENKGNTVIRDLPVDIDLSGNVTLREVITDAIQPFSLYNLVLSAGLSQAQNLDFVCATALLDNDLATAGNRNCIELDGGDFLFTPFPNPAKDFLRVEWITTNEQKVRLKIVDTFGREVRAIAPLSNAGLNQVAFDLETVPNGVYYLIISTKTASKTHRIVVANQN